MSAPAESVILCEGFHDRAFWKGWLEHLGFRDARARRSHGFGDAVDPFGKKVVSGQFAFLSPSGAFLRLRPCNGVEGVLEQTAIRLEQRKTQALRRLVVNRDTDDDDSGAAPRAESALQSIKDRVGRADASSSSLPDGDLSVDGGATIVSTVLWSAADAPAPHLPAQQTLERLVCAALGAAYPERAAAVAQWLSSRPDAAPPGPKEHAWSHMAGWYGASGCDDFYQAIWRDAAVVAELEARLQKSGAARVALALST